jgi:hypothetical protein
MKRNGEELTDGTDVHNITPERTLLETREIKSSQHRAQVRLELEKVQ